MRRVFFAALIVLIVIGLPIALRILLQLKARQTRLQCRQCQGPIVKIRRQPWDRQISWLLPVRRYRCMDPRCRWQGLFVVAWGEKSHGLTHVPHVLIAPSEMVDPTQRWISQMQNEELYDKVLKAIKQGDDTAALQDLNQILSQDESQADAYFLRGQLYQRLGKQPLAQQDLQTAAKLSAEQANKALAQKVTVALQSLD